jgi:hypothetical protein
VKYFTPELLARYRSTDDAIADAASDEWERACEAYAENLKSIRPGLSSAVRRLLRRFSLHDAKVLAMAADEVPHFSIFLELENPKGKADRHLELRYRLVGGAKKGYEWVRHPMLAGDGKPFGWWMYDEMDVSDGPVPAMTHSILFTGGEELRLTFFSLSCRRLDFLFPPTTAEGLANLEAAGRQERQPA